MAGFSYDSVTLNQFFNDEVVFKRVLKYLIWRSSNYFAIKGLPILEGAKGEKPEDIVSAAIEAIVTDPSKFDPSRGSLVGYLVLNLIRTKVGNLAKLAAVRKEVVASDQEGWDIDSESETDHFEDHAKLVIAKVSHAVKGDDDVENILLGRLQGMKREEIMLEFSLDTKRYNNGYRRLMARVEALGNEALRKFIQ